MSDLGGSWRTWPHWPKAAGAGAIVLGLVIYGFPDSSRAYDLGRKTAQEEKRQQGIDGIPDTIVSGNWCHDWAVETAGHTPFTGDDREALQEGCDDGMNNRSRH